MHDFGLIRTKTIMTQDAADVTSLRQALPRAKKPGTFKCRRLSRQNMLQPIDLSIFFLLG